MRLVDTHAHLAMLEQSPLENILAHAKAQGVEKMVTVSTDEGSWESNRNIATAHPHIFYTLGLHPHDSLRFAECAGQLNDFFTNGAPEKCVGIGEMGLDFHYNFSPREIQLDVFEAQLVLAKKVELPIIIHCRDAFSELYETIRRVGLSDRGGVMHCFTGNTEQALEAIELGLMISFSGILTFKNSAPLRETAGKVPDSSLLVETDCPFLAPVPFRGKPNEPAFLPMTAQTLAAARGVAAEYIADLTFQNAIRFFRI